MALCFSSHSSRSSQQAQAFFYNEMINQAVVKLETDTDSNDIIVLEPLPQQPEGEPQEAEGEQRRMVHEPPANKEECSLAVSVLLNS